MPKANTGVVLLRRRVIDPLLRLLVRPVYRLFALSWIVRRPRTFGVHALPLTPEGRIVLVKLRYAGGWRLPGGGRREDEDPQEAVLRELREEIGMIHHGRVEAATTLEEVADHRRDLVSLFVVHDVEYQPRWSWEIEDVIEADPDQLPQGLSPRAAGWLNAIEHRI